MIHKDRPRYGIKITFKEPKFYLWPKNMLLLNCEFFQSLASAFLCFGGDVAHYSSYMSPLEGAVSAPIPPPPDKIKSKFGANCC